MDDLLNKFHDDMFEIQTIMKEKLAFGMSQTIAQLNKANEKISSLMGKYDDNTDKGLYEINLSKYVKNATELGQEFNNNLNIYNSLCSQFADIKQKIANKDANLKDILNNCERELKNVKLYETTDKMNALTKAIINIRETVENMYGEGIERRDEDLRSLDLDRLAHETKNENHSLKIAVATLQDLNTEFQEITKIVLGI